MRTESLKRDAQKSEMSLSLKCTSTLTVLECSLRLAGQAIYFTKAMSAMTHMDISYVLRDLLNAVFDLHNCSEFVSEVVITPKSRSQGWHAFPESTQLFHR